MDISYIHHFVIGQILNWIDFLSILSVQLSRKHKLSFPRDSLRSTVFLNEATGKFTEPSYPQVNRSLRGLTSSVN